MSPLQFNTDFQPVGCDMMLGSDAKEDKCRECKGNGTHCQTMSGVIDTQDYVQGNNYNNTIFNLQFQLINPGFKGTVAHSVCESS